MKNNKLFNLLSALDTKEFKAFHRFIKSQNPKKKTKSQELFEFIKHHHIKFRINHIDYSVIYKYLTKKRSKKEIEKKYVIDRMSDLSKQVEKFMAIQVLNNNPKKMNNLVNDFLLKNKKNEIFVHKMENEIKKLEKNTSFDWKYHHNLWQIKYKLISNQFKSSFHIKNDSLQSAMNSLDEAFVILKLRHGLHEISKTMIFNRSNNICFLDEIRIKYSTHPNLIIQIYLKIINCFEEYQNISQNKFKNEKWDAIYTQLILKNNIALIPKDDIRIAFRAMINLGNKIALHKSSNNKYKKILKLYKVGLENGIWGVNGKLSSTTFLNIVSIASSIEKELQWAEKFISDYTSFCPETTVLISKIFIAFFKKEFNSVLQISEKLTKLNSGEKLLIKTFKLKSQYEIYESQDIISNAIETYDKFIKGNEFSDEKYKGYHHFVLMLKALNKQKTMYIKDRNINSLEKKIANYDIIVSYNWLKQKINELKINKGVHLKRQPL